MASDGVHADFITLADVEIWQNLGMSPYKRAQAASRMLHIQLLRVTVNLTATPSRKAQLSLSADETKVTTIKYFIPGEHPDVL